MSKQANDALRARYVAVIREALEKAGEEVLQTASGELCIPCVDNEGNDQFCCFVVKVTTGTRDGEAYDGYSMAEEFQMKQADREAKAKAAAAKKAAKIAKDEKMRAQKAAAKAAHEVNKNGEGA